MPINQIPVGLDGDRGTDPLPDKKAREQPLVRSVAARIVEFDTKVSSGNRYHPFERLGSAERG